MKIYKVIDIDEYSYELRSSDMLTSEKIKDFIEVYNKVFNLSFMELDFERQYINNIYGNSLILIVYKNDVAVATDTMWRNDLEYYESYQSCGTGIMKEHRGKGIFQNTTQILISNLPKNAIIYGFPNSNSFHGYMKLGWINCASFSYEFMLWRKDKEFNQLGYIDPDYARWWLNLQNHFNLRYMKRKGKYYLIKKTKFPGVFSAIGEISKEVIDLYQKTIPIILFYRVNNGDGFFSRKLSKIELITWGDTKGYKILYNKCDIV